MHKSLREFFIATLQRMLFFQKLKNYIVKKLKFKKRFTKTR